MRGALFTGPLAVPISSLAAERLRHLVIETPDAVRWLNDLGVMFDKDEDGRMVTSCGGTSCKLYVEEMPLFVIIDSEGNNLYESGRQEYLAARG